MPPRIAVLGSFMQAACWQMQRQPRPGETLQATGFASEAGGKGLAVAVGCRRLGAAVDLLLSIGDDAAGDALLKRLGDEDLPTRHVARSPGCSGHGAAWLSADGANTVAVFTGANDRLDASQVAGADDVLAGAALVYAQFETPMAAAREAFSRARRRGACTVLNPSPWQAPDRELLACTQVLLVNESEAARLVKDWPGDVQPQHAAFEHALLQPLWASWPGGPERLLVVTLGGRGSVAFTPAGGIHFAPGLAVDVCSSIGAGDAFAAGWCTSRIHGHSIAKSLHFGNACGGFAVSHDGILDALPRAADIEGWR